MNIYQRKMRSKYMLFIVAVLIGVGSLWYTNILVEKLAKEERKKVEMWAKATSLIISSDMPNDGMNFLVGIIEQNETIPVIILDDSGKIIYYRNLDTTKVKNPKYVEKRLQKMRSANDSIVIENSKQYLYYDRSIILSQLIKYPYIQLTVIILFILAAYFAFSSSRKAEQNQVWLGLSKETAHQLGTPISSLMAWKEILKVNSKEDQLVEELEKDILRLEKITERFSKIGSKPRLKPEDLNSLVESVVKYLKTRSSDKIEFQVLTPDEPVIAPLNASLFEWVIENVCKNAMDAIQGKGAITVSVIDNPKYVYVDISDT
ncbi:MAG: HAMP domain-containing histidine kinase, partial [Bacteroidales bacterium]|nr:HAMP domain-containing histidine kinase [Bacteroidales bacterium]